MQMPIHQKITSVLNCSISLCSCTSEGLPFVLRHSSLASPSLSPVILHSLRSRKFVAVSPTKTLQSLLNPNQLLTQPLLFMLPSRFELQFLLWKSNSGYFPARLWRRLDPTDRNETPQSPPHHAISSLYQTYELPKPRGTRSLIKPEMPS